MASKPAKIGGQLVFTHLRIADNEDTSIFNGGGLHVVRTGNGALEYREDS